MALLPVFGFFALYYLNRPMMEPMLSNPTGQMVLAYAAGSIMVGYFVLMKIADIDL